MAADIDNMKVYPMNEYDLETIATLRFYCREYAKLMEGWMEDIWDGDAEMKAEYVSRLVELRGAIMAGRNVLDHGMQRMLLQRRATLAEY